MRASLLITQILSHNSFTKSNQKPKTKNHADSCWSLFFWNAPSVLWYVLFVCLSVLARVEEDAEQNLQDQLMDAYALKPQSIYQFQSQTMPTAVDPFSSWKSPSFSGMCFLFVWVLVRVEQEMEQERQDRLTALGSESSLYWSYWFSSC